MGQQQVVSVNNCLENVKCSGERVHNPLTDPAKRELLNNIMEEGDKRQRSYADKAFPRRLLGSSLDRQGFVPMQSLASAFQGESVHNVLRELKSAGVLEESRQFDEMYFGSWVDGVRVAGLGRELLKADVQPESLPRIALSAWEE